MWSGGLGQNLGGVSRGSGRHDLLLVQAVVVLLLEEEEVEEELELLLLGLNLDNLQVDIVVLDEVTLTTSL